ncbi:MAG: SIR2 family protein [Chloroflexi bacterium]|nr:SIR2 family protein [Chloroflexota bacterium]
MNVLIGSGLTTALAKTARAPDVDMSPAAYQCNYTDELMQAAREGAQRLRRDQPNIEDQVRTINELIGGLRVLASTVDAGDGADEQKQSAATALQEWESALDSTLTGLLKKLLATERGIASVLADAQDDASAHVRRLLGGFLLPFASRTATRERTHIFTTNYDRLIERGCDLLGLRVVDRFVGSLAPVFHSSRLGIDLHYNPPGIRGEPRYLEGVVRITKLHGSLDWRSATGPSGGLEVQRCGLPFGAADNYPDVPAETGTQLLIYPNAAKDVETLEFPYAELFRDFAAAVCQPNAVVVTYGYGFGDDHVNRVLRDMLSIPSTHLVVVSYDEAGGRLQAFHDRWGTHIRRRRETPAESAHSFRSSRNRFRAPGFFPSGLRGALG